MKKYPSDLTDDQWELITPLIPQPKFGNRLRKTSEQLFVKALLSYKSYRMSMVERTFEWRNKYRRLSKNYEILPKNSETWIKISIINILDNELRTLYEMR